MPKTFPIQLSDELHRQLKHASIDDGLSLHDWIVQALEKSLNGAPKAKKTQPNARTSR